MSKLQIYKNLLHGCRNTKSFPLLSNYNPTNALVTSTAGKTLGNITYSLNYLFSTVFTLLSIPVLNSQIRKRKGVLWINNVALIIFTTGNLYTSYYTLIPASIFHRFVIAMACVALLVVNKLAVYYAEVYTLNSKSVYS